MQTVETCAELDATVDVVLVCVKGYDLDKVGREMAGRLRPDAIYITLQNGVDNVERLESALGGPERALVMGGLTYIVATKVGPGVIHQSPGPKRVAFGPTRMPVATEVRARPCRVPSPAPRGAAPRSK